ncbi:LysR family transcriptional regulator [Lonsdalea quercina]|uniref:LysR family transcriptional regulator n=1 Tax=Lonsdalea quercina TaxID=71657 RepID=UPI003974EA3E
MDNFDTIPFFIAVVETGSFSSAARKLAVTKSAVSKRISQFEDELGIRLLNRTTRKISLTEAGLKYYEYARAANLLVKEGAGRDIQNAGHRAGSVADNRSDGVRQAAYLSAYSAFFAAKPTNRTAYVNGRPDGGFGR